MDTIMHPCSLFNVAYKIREDDLISSAYGLSIE